MFDAMIKQMMNGPLAKGAENIAEQFKVMNAQLAVIAQQNAQIIALLQQQQRELEQWKAKLAA